jgi:endonuclease YncB( thermonuclease family)
MHNSAMKTLLAICLFLISQAVHPDVITGKVIKVTDGDTVDILDANFTKHHVRLNGIDAPEKDQPFGRRAQQKLSEFVFGKEVDFDWVKTDHRDRPVGVVFVAPIGCSTCDKTVDAGFEVVKAGLAWHYKEYQRNQTPEDRVKYAEAEDWARAAQTGLWIDPNPVPPWEWRKAKREAYKKK